SHIRVVASTGGFGHRRELRTAAPARARARPCAGAGRAGRSKRLHSDRGTAKARRECGKIADAPPTNAALSAGLPPVVPGYYCSRKATSFEVRAVKEARSRCPINLSLEIFGDRWTLLVLRDVVFGGARHFRELLGGEERISSNVLADRLAALVE